MGKLNYVKLYIMKHPTVTNYAMKKIIHNLSKKVKYIIEFFICTKMYYKKEKKEKKK